MVRTTEGNTVSALDHPLAEALLDLDALDLLNHLRPESLVLLLVFDMSELASIAAGSTERLLLDSIKCSLDGLGDGVLVAQPCGFPGRREGRSVGKGDLVELHAENRRRR